jgi:ABC-type transporter Mla subunit MlaD
VCGELARRTTQLKGLVRDGATTMGRLASVEHPLGALIDQLPPTLRELPASLTTVDAASSELTPAARSLVPVAGALAPALSALKRFSPAATTALAALNRPLPGLTGLLRQARPLASQLGRAFALLRPQAPELGRVTAAIIPCETAVQNFFQWTLSVSKLSGLHGDMQRGVLVASPQSLTGLVAPTINTEQGLLSTAPTCSGVPAGP